MAAKESKGYVVFIRMYSVADNPTYDGGAVRVMYGGAGKTMLGNGRFEPYKSEDSAKRGAKAWDKWFKQLGEIADGWKYQVGGVMPVTDEMYKEIEDQLKLEYDIVANALAPSDEEKELMEKAIKRSNFKRLK